jgi:hypothetical protein
MLTSFRLLVNLTGCFLNDPVWGEWKNDYQVLKIVKNKRYLYKYQARILMVQIEVEKFMNF